MEVGFFFKLHHASNAYGIYLDLSQLDKTKSEMRNHESGACDQKEKSRGFKSGECGGQGWAHLQEMTLS